MGSGWGFWGFKREHATEALAIRYQGEVADIPASVSLRLGLKGLVVRLQGSPTPNL